MGRRTRATFDCAGAKIIFVFLIFDDHAVLCAVKSDKRKFKDKPFINRSCLTSIIKALRLLQVFLCKGVAGQDGGFSATSIWRAHFRAIFELFRGFLQIVVNVKINKYHVFGKCNTSLISRVPILGFS